MPSALGWYKAWVRANPGMVSNLDWLLYLGVWSPGRLSGSEANYEMYHALVGLLGVWHQSIIDEVTQQGKRPIYHLWLDALEQLETLIELRAMHLEAVGKMSRYGPLLAMESIKACLKMAVWSQYPARCQVFLRNPGPADLQHWEAKQGITDLMAGMRRLRMRYTGGAGASAANLRADALLAVAAAVRWTWYRVYGDESVAGRPDGMGPSANGSPFNGGTPHEASSVSLSAWAALDGRRGQASTPAGGASSRGVDAGPGKAEEEAERADRAERHMGSNLLWLGELLHIWRPVIYVSLLKSHKRTSWRPWTTSLLVDLASMYFQARGKWHLRQAGEVRHVPAVSSLLSLALLRSLGSQSWSAGEEKEVADRRRKLLLYLLRGPALDMVVKGPLSSLRSRLAGVPLAGFMTEYLSGCVDTFTDYYTYTSGSS